MKQEIISVITPSFNQGQFLEETICSILSQKGDFYIDYIIMDGNSSDNSVEVIKKYENLLAANCDTTREGELKYYIKRDEAFPWLNCRGVSYRWQSEKDRGQCHALKKGFKIAEGEIYYWLNSDDTLVNENVFQTIFALFDKEPGLELVIGDGIYISKQGEKTGVYQTRRIDFKELVYLDYHILQPSAFFLKTIYVESYLKEAYTCSFDVDFFTHLLADGVSYKKVSDIFGAFRFYPETKTLGMGKTRYREQKEISRDYSKNIFYYIISSLYRYFEIVLKPRYYSKSKLFRFIFILTRKMSYLLVTGKTDRR
jgi:glycosyltransferase involved in cell wall biosynthesis